MSLPAQPNGNRDREMIEAGMIIIIGNIAHCIAPYELFVITNGYVIVDDGKILAIGKEDKLEETRLKLGVPENAKVTHLRHTQLLIPGLIDTHIHAPQYPNAGLGYDQPLLEWLDTYTYNLEKKYKDAHLAKKVFNAVVRKTISHGTTTACYFASMYHDISMILVDAAIAHGQRALIGKVNMIRMAPPDYIETAEESIKHTKRFVADVLKRKSDLVKPVITPRFALSVDQDLMKTLGEIAAEYDLHIQTHISENKEEVKFVHELYNQSYAGVYDEANLLTKKTVLAHGVYLTEEELRLIADRGASISHCPESNNNLRSGMCDVAKLINHGISVGLGTDVAGGASPSVINAMRSTIATSINLSFSKTSYTALTWKEAFHLATLGGAKALAMDDKIGNFEVGKEFDALIIDVDVDDSAADLLLPTDPLENLQKFIYLGDNRNVLRVYVAGRRVK